MQYMSKKFEPYKIATYDAERTYKAAAKATDQKLYAEISSLDLIAKEFKVHANCYQNFIRGFSGALRSSSNECTSSASQEKRPTYDAGNFDKAKEYVSLKVIEFGKAVSMKTLHELSVEDTQYRHKLKQRLQRHFGDTILLLSPPGKRYEVVISASCFDGNVN